MSRLRSVRSGSSWALACGCTLAATCGGSPPGEDAGPVVPSDASSATADLAGAALCAADGDHLTTLVFVNGCERAVTFAGSDITGGSLAPGEARCMDIGSDVEALSGKRYWGFVGQDPGPERHTLAEFTFNTTFNDFDWYDISMVDAFNLPMQIVPLARPSCKTLTCAMDLLAGCPAVGQVRDSAGSVVVCISPSRDDPESPVALYFEICDDAYAWSGDDAQGSDPSPMRACAGEDWQIVFCPEASS
jgi:hypothetical protein